MRRTPLSNHLGFRRQLRNEARAAGALKSSASLTWDTVYLSAGPRAEAAGRSGGVTLVRVPRALSNPLLMRLYQWAFVLRRARAYDHVLVRYQLLDPFAALALRLRPNVSLVHHTKPVEEMRASPKLRWLAPLERLLFGATRRASKRAVGVTGELARHGLRPGRASLGALTYPNALEGSVAGRVAQRGEGGTVTAAFISSSFPAWQGLEELVELARVWEPLTKGLALKVHVVGELSGAQAADLRGPFPHVEFVLHGYRESSEFWEHAGPVDVGLAPLALRRKGMKEACSLKVRDYLSRGVPVYSTHSDSALPEGFPFYLHDSQLDLDHLTGFALAHRDSSGDLVASTAAPLIDKGAIMLRLASALGSGG